MKATAWLHTMDNTEGHPENEPWCVLSFDATSPFGVPGKNYSASYPVTKTPLYDIDVDKIDAKLSGALCCMSFGGARAFVKEAREMITGEEYD